MFDDFDIDDSSLELDVPSVGDVLNTEIGNSIEWHSEDDPIISHIHDGLEDQPCLSSVGNSTNEIHDCGTSSSSSYNPNASDTDIDDLASIRDDLDKELNGSAKGQNISFGTAFCWNFCRAGTDAGNARYHVQHGC